MMNDAHTTPGDLLSWIRQHFRVAEEHGPELVVHCPFHSDSTPSAGVNVERRAFNCFRCGDSVPGKLTEVAARLGWPAPPFPGGNGRPEETEYPYRNAEGKVVAVKRRYYRDGRKAFAWYDASGGKTLRGKGIVLPLYRLPELLGALGRGEVVAVCEGEKNADDLARLGIPATTCPGGAGKWRPADSETFPAGASVLVFYDADLPGVKHRDQVCSALVERGCAVKVVELGYQVTEDHGRDVSDWIAAADPFTCESDFLALLKGAKAWSAEGPAEAKGKSELAPGLVYRLASEIEPVPIRWLWKDRIPLGKLALIVGDGGLGKTTVAHNLVARTTARAPWPDGEENTEPGSAVILNAEDDPADTTVPRLVAAGAVCERVVLVDGVRRRDESGKLKAGYFNLDTDLGALEERIRELGDCKVVVLDPLSAYLGGRVNAWREDDVRRVLGPVAAMAARHGVAVLGIMHPNKSTTATVLHRISGSAAFGNSARMVWMVAPDPTDETEQRKLFLPSKANIVAPGIGGLAFKTVQDSKGQPVVEWERGVVSMDVSTAMSNDPGELPGACAEAAKWLRDFLAEGEQNSTDVYKAGKGAGHAERTLRRAQRALGIKPRKSEGGWRWALPGAPEGGGDEIDF